VGHNREMQGYSYTYYDVDNADERQYTFSFTPLNFNDSIYITVSTYQQEIVPSKCMTSEYYPEVLLKIYVGSTLQ
jgi:hypothetical protein